MNQTNLVAAMLMAAASKNKSVPQPMVRDLIDERLTRGKTRKGAKHIVGSVFKSRSKLTLNDGKTIVTPAMYRKMHLGIEKKRQQNGPKSNPA